MVIRDYDVADAAAVKDLLVQLQEHLIALDNENVQVMSDRYRNEYFDKVMREISANCGRMYVASKDGTLLGVIAGIIEPKDEDDRLTNRCPKRGKILELVVSPESRACGVGTALMDKMESYFLEQQCEFVCTDVFAPNQKAIHFYQTNSYLPRNIEMYKRLGEKHESNIP